MWVYKLVSKLEGGLIWVTLFIGGENQTMENAGRVAFRVEQLEQYRIYVDLFQAGGLTKAEEGNRVRVIIEKDIQLANYLRSHRREA